MMMATAFSTTFATLALSSRSEGKIGQAVIVLTALVIFYFINRSRRRKLLSEVDKDPRLTHEFNDAVTDFTPPDPDDRWNYGWLWAGIITAAIGFFMAVGGEGLVRPIGVVLLFGGSVLAFLDYRFGFSKGEPGEVLLRIEFHDAGVRLTHLLSGRTEHTFGPSLALTVTCRELTEKSFGADSLQGYGFFLKMQAPAPADVEILMDSAGAAEFLALARSHGSPVLISKESPAWFREKLEACPSWQPGYSGN